MNTNGFDAEFDFVPPPETAVFEPTEEEFKDALAYIEKIRPVAEEYGICKIRPPEDWQPPFAVDVDKLRFTPRIQRLNELEAHTRIKLNFLDQVAKFWELQGSTLKIPLVDKRALDLYTLKKYVQKEGGMEKVTSEKKWQKVATDMGYNMHNRNIAALLKAHYERIIYPLDVFEREEQKKTQQQLQQQVKNEDDVDTKEEDEEEEDSEKEYKPHNIPSRMGMKPPSDKDKAARRSHRYSSGSGSAPPPDSSTSSAPIKKEDGMESKSSSPSNSFSKELARLQFFGAGPKFAGLPSGKSTKEKTRGLKLNFEYDPLAKYMCQTCGKGDAEEQMLLCDGCDDSYHTFCLVPPLVEIPKGDWRCPKCVAAEVSKPLEAFGFEQAQKEYTLQSFGEMADQFKSDYFNMPVHLIPASLVEKEYWRILENIDEDVMIEYGADLHTMDHGSGFPTMTSKNLSKEDEVYAKSDWNLNRLPVAANSVLRSIDMDISGMKVPWLYVGMCFSTFCWHTEDHWTPSINYLHWGEPKTWYGIPAKYAEKAEEVMRESAKELFMGQPDLLHHIVTTMNPNVLEAHGVPVYRTDQHAGEFVITFPRGYHAGFNNGYNLAEAVNFAPPDWLEMGRKCVEHYSMMRRYCVFCHDELVCNMATQADKLTLAVAASTYKDMVLMLEKEKQMRRQLLEAGVTEAEREAFELLPDDERQCAICKTTCFLSALASLESKESNEIVCLRHFKSMECEPDKLILRYRYTLDELASLLVSLRKRAESYDEWVDKVKKAMEAKGDDRMELSEFKDMLEEAQEFKYPETELSNALALTVEEAEKCQTVANQLANKKVRTRTRGVVDAKYRLTVDELELFSNQLETLPTKVTGHEAVEYLLDQVETCRKRAKKLLAQDPGEAAESEEEVSKEIAECIENCLCLDVDLEELQELRTRHKQVEWLEEVMELLDEDEEEETDRNPNFEQLRGALQAGSDLPAHPAVERALGKISGLLKQADEWETKTKSCLNANPKWDLNEVENLVKEGEVISHGLPGLSILRDAVRKAKDWITKVEVIKSPDSLPYIESVEMLIAKGKNIPVRLEMMPHLETQAAQARAWRERTGRVFLKKSSPTGPTTLLDILAPRFDIIGGGEPSKKRKRTSKDDSISSSPINVQHPIYQHMTAKDLSNAQQVIQAYKDVQTKELLAINELREKRKASTPGEEDKKEGMRALFDCELCLGSFQPSQVVPMQKAPLPSRKYEENGGGGQVSTTSLRDVKFMCPNCVRTRRPRLETILSLLVSLHKLTVRLPEGEALQCLTERAISWREKVQKVFEVNDDVSEALAKLKDHPLGGSVKKKTKQSSEEGSGEELDTSLEDLEDDGGVKRAATPLEIKLSPKSINLLETLMVEGDLQEVSMDETHSIWQLLQASEPRRSKSFPDLDKLEAELESVREEKIMARKARNLEAQEAAAAKTKVDQDDSGLSSTKSGKNKNLGKKSSGTSAVGDSSPTKKRKKDNYGLESKDVSDDGDNDEDDEEQEDCSAPKCMRPTGKEVHWVQCDGCELWFHLFCIGLKPEQVSEDEDFICKSCNPNRHRKRKSDIR